MEQSQIDRFKGILEALLFVSDKPISLDQFKQVVPELGALEIRDLLKLLETEYAQREGGIVLTEIAGGFQMLSNVTYAQNIRDFYKTYHKEKLSRPSLESLAIVAYKQPVSRADIELVRGVNSDGVVSHLLNKGLIKIVGRKEVPGRPFLYGTTKEFLDYFGLKSLEDLPRLEEFEKMNVDADAQAGGPAAPATEAPPATAAETPAPDSAAAAVPDAPDATGGAGGAGKTRDEILEEALASQEPSGQARLLSATNPDVPLEEKTENGPETPA